MLASSCLPLTATRPPAPAQEHDKGKQPFDDVSFRCPFERIAKHLSDFVDDGDFVQQCKEVYYEVLFPSPPYPYKTGAPLSPPPSSSAAPRRPARLGGTFRPALRVGQRSTDRIFDVTVGPEKWPDFSISA